MPTPRNTVTHDPLWIYILTARDGDDVGAATVNWVTQTSFEPPLIAIGVKAGSGPLEVLKKVGNFALNMCAKSQQDMAFGFFKPAKVEGETISGEPFHLDSTGSPILENTPASVEFKVVEKGDHHVVIGEVINAHLRTHPDGRADEAILEMKELDDNVFYGG